MISRKRRDWQVTWRKITRPWCSGSEFGGHTMIEYRSRGTKICADCQYSEKLYVKVE